MRSEPVHALALGLAEGEILNPDPPGIIVNPIRDPFEAVGGEKPGEDQHHGKAPPAHAQIGGVKMPAGTMAAPSSQ